MRGLFRISIGLVFILFTLYRCFANLGSTPAVRWDEQTNVDVITSTMFSRTFPLLSLGGLPFFEKPPLWYYLGYVVNLGTATPLPLLRTLSAVFGFLTIILTVWLALKWWGDISAIIAAVMLLATNHLFVQNPGGIFSSHTFRSADVDSLFIFLLITAYALSCRIPVSPPAVLAAGLVSGLAFLTKGPFGIVPLGIAVSLIYRHLTHKQKQYLAGAVMLCTGMILPWYSAMTLLYGPAFLTSHIGYHIIGRTFIPLEGHTNPLWYYVTILGNPQIFPFGIPVILSVVLILWKRLYTKDYRLTSALLMSAACFFIPTLVQTKLAWYILPFYPFAALTAAGSVADLLHVSSGSRNSRKRHRMVQ